MDEAAAVAATSRRQAQETSPRSTVTQLLFIQASSGVGCVEKRVGAYVKTSWSIQASSRESAHRFTSC